MKTKGFIRFVNNDKELAEAIADQINKDFPGCAKGLLSSCYIKKDYYQRCIKYVEELHILKEQKHQREMRI